MTDAPKHPINPDPANELASDSSAIDPRDFRNALGTYATGVTIITAVAADGKPYGLTCNSFASVSLNPPLVLWSLGMFSQGLSIFQNASHFTVNVLGASQQALANKFAKSSEDKFAGVEWTPGPRQRADPRGQRGEFPMPCGQSILWRRPRHLPGRGRGLCLQPAGAAVVCARRLRPVSQARRRVMSKKVPPKRARAKQKRLSPDDRRREFVAKATEFFSEEGFDGGTRDLARRLGVTQPLLYRYFPSKDDLIKEVYRTVYLEPFDPGWEKLLTDRSRPIRDRLQEFYQAYTDVIFTRKWLRIYFYAGLKGLDINRLVHRGGGGQDSVAHRQGMPPRSRTAGAGQGRRRPSSRWHGCCKAASSITGFANTSSNRPCWKTRIR